MENKNLILIDCTNLEADQEAEITITRKNNENEN